MELSKKEILSTSWDQTKNNLFILITITIIYLMIMVTLFQIFTIMSPGLAQNITSPNIVQALRAPQISLQQILFIIAAILFITGINLGFIQICLNIFKGESANTRQVFSSFHLLVPYIAATFYYTVVHILIATPGIIILFITIKANLNEVFYYIGILSIIIPTLYLSLRLQFYIYFLIDKDCGLLDSIRKSAHISKGHVYQLLVLGIILSLIIQISLIPYFIGLIISIPYSKMATTYLYIQLEENH